MSYPSPPWKLYGWAGLLVDWLPLERAKEALLPLGFVKTPCGCGGTLGGHYIASYQPKEGVTIPEPFHEFGYLSCLARLGTEKGLHLARMAVDHPQAIEGGREVWGLNKFEARFEEIAPYGLHAISEEQKVDVSVIFKKRIPLGPWTFSRTFVNRVEGRPVKYQVTLKGLVYFCTVERKGFHHNGRLFPLLFDHCTVTIEAPIPIPDTSEGCGKAG